MKEWILQKRSRIIISGMLITAVPLVSLALFIYASFSRQLEDILIDENRTLVTIAASRIDAGLASTISVGEVMAPRPLLIQAVRNNDRNAMREHLKSLIENYDRIEQAFITTPKGILIAGYPDDSLSLGKDFSYRDWYKGVSKNWTPYVSEYYKRAIVPVRHVFTVAVPIKDEKGVVLGIFAMQPRADFINKFLQDIRIGNGTAYVVDKNGNLIFHTGFIPDELRNYAQDPVVSLVMQKKAGVQKLTDPATRTEAIYAYRPITLTDWGVVIKRPASDVLAPLNQTIVMLIGFTMLMLIGGGAMAFAAARQLFLIQKLSLELREEELVEKAYNDLLVLLNSPWSDEKDMSLAFLRRLGEHLCLEGGVFITFEEGAVVPCASFMVPLPQHVDGLIDECVKQQKLLKLRDVPPERMLTIDTAVSGKLAPRDIVAVPLLLNEQAVGALELACVHGFQPRHYKIIEHIAPQLAGSLNAIRDNRKLRELSDALAVSNEELRVVNEELQVANEELLTQQAELAEANKRLDIASRTKSDFLSNMSHELRTPLNSVIGFSEVLQDRLFGELNDRQREYVAAIMSSGRHLLSLINDILDLAKVEAGKDELSFSRIPLRKTLMDSMSLLGETAMKHGVSMNLRIETSEDLSLDVDARKFKQILFNLLGNAIKFTPEKGSVTLTARAVTSESAGQRFPDLPGLDVPGYLEISIADTGIGIRQEDMPKLFKEFSQIETPYTKKYDGTGLGLTLSKKFVLMHGGRIWVESEEGKGSTFSFLLPLRHSEPASGVSDPERSRAPRAGSRTALVIEDDRTALAMIRGVLEQAEYRVLVAADAENGIAAALREHPDIIILDLVLPGMDGLEILRRLGAGAETAAIPVIILTTMQLSEKERRTLSPQVHFVFEKGCLTKEQFIETVRRVFNEKPFAEGT